MTFTDDDLKRLKEGRMSVDTFNQWCPALLARLEAGENYIGGRSVLCGDCGNVVAETDCDRELYKAWRGSRGEYWDGNDWRKEAGK